MKLSAITLILCSLIVFNFAFEHEKIQPVQNVDPFSEIRHLTDNLFTRFSNDSLSTSLPQFQNSSQAKFELQVEDPPVLLLELNSQTHSQASALIPSIADGSIKTRFAEPYCEVCMMVVQLKYRGQPHLCAGLDAHHYMTCVEVLESFVNADKAFVYWMKNGCLHMNPTTGPEIIKPCPPVPVCSWIPNLFAPKGRAEALCSMSDTKFLPAIPSEYADKAQSLDGKLRRSGPNDGEAVYTDAQGNQVTAPAGGFYRHSQSSIPGK